MLRDAAAGDAAERSPADSEGSQRRVTPFSALAAAVGFFAGAVGGMAGFGVGSILTPLLALHLGTRTAVAAVTIPHIVANAIRFWTLRGSLDRRVLLTFGLTSAAGGLAGALLHAVVASRLLTLTLAVLLILTGITGFAGITFRFGRRGTWVAGGVSGLLGGLVGSQGPIRAGAMTQFNLSKETFVATSTAIALIVDLARLPVYFVSDGRFLLHHGWLFGIVTGATVAGTLTGRMILASMPETAFRRGVSALIAILGAVLLFKE